MDNIDTQEMIAAMQSAEEVRYWAKYEVKFPEPVAWFAEYGGDIYTADQLRAAVEADREQRVVLSDDNIEDLCMELFTTAQGNSSMEEKLARIDAIVRRCLSEQPAQQPLTEKEIGDVMQKAIGYGLSPSRDDLEFARAIERTHGIADAAMKEQGYA